MGIERIEGLRTTLDTVDTTLKKLTRSLLLEGILLRNGHSFTKRVTVKIAGIYQDIRFRVYDTDGNLLVDEPLKLTNKKLWPQDLLDRWDDRGKRWSL